MKITYWIPIRTIAGTEKDRWLECSNYGNKINKYDLEELRFYPNSPEEYDEAIKTQYHMCEKCGSKMDTGITLELKRMKLAKGSYGLKETVQKIIDYRNKNKEV